MSVVLSNAQRATIAMLMALLGPCLRADEPAPSPGAPGDCQKILGVRPGLSIHEIVAILGSPDRVGLSGEDQEFPNPQPTDNLLFDFDRPFTIKREFAVSLTAIVPAGSTIATILSVFVGNPADREFRGVPEKEVRDWLGEPTYVSPRRWDIDDVEGSLSDCEDPSGTVELWVYRSICVEVWLDWTDRKSLPHEAYLIRIDPAVATNPRPPRCPEKQVEPRPDEAY